MLTKSSAIGLTSDMLEDIGQMLLTLSTQLVMILRIFAMYGNSKRVVVLFGALTTGEFAFWIVLLVRRISRGYDGTSTNEPVPGVFICANGDFPKEHWAMFFDTSIIIVESVLLLLALYKLWAQRKDEMPNKLLMRLTMESIFYFIAVFGIYMIDQGLWIVNHASPLLVPQGAEPTDSYYAQLTLDELVTGFRNAIPPILVNRLMISVRSAYYDHDLADDTVSHLLRFAGQPTSSAVLGAPIELRTFD
ncbi:hypothetical protein OE88DRAFT_1735898 [Heliocybe sulcata]|uniref:Uncharacterized protein n=1 Tax=Heliocybe sulcata TaxID=5364 RepID=A0A5C3MZ55_9AGAM|nr:hypothetical protein OE88DRAFT_1735898 [Heliocybe sulcata]